MVKRRLIFVLLAVLLVASGCGSTDEISGVEKEIKDKVSKSAVMPEISGMEAGYIYLENPPVVNGKPLGDIHKANISYGREIGELDPLWADNREALEEQQNIKILYGPYKGDRILDLYIAPGVMEQGSFEIREIAGEEVFYQVLKEGRPAVVAVVHAEELFYMMTFYISDSFIEIDAIKVIEEIIAQVK